MPNYRYNNPSAEYVAAHNINVLIHEQNVFLHSVRVAEANQAAGHGHLPPRLDQARAARVVAQAKAHDQNVYHWTVINGKVADVNSIATCLRFDGALHLIDEVGMDGSTGLQMAAQEGKIEFVHAFLANSANVNAYFAHQDMTALLLAINRGHADVVNVLLANNANHAFARRDGTTALHLAAQLGHTDIVSALLANGAALNPKMRENETTPLQLAARFGKTDVVNVLLAYGADPHAAKEGVMSALENAEHFGHTDVVNALQGRGASTSAPRRRQQTSPHGASTWQAEASLSPVLRTRQRDATNNVQARMDAARRERFESGREQETNRNQPTVGCCTIS